MWGCEWSRGIPLRGVDWVDSRDNPRQRYILENLFSNDTSRKSDVIRRSLFEVFDAPDFISQNSHYRKFKMRLEECFLLIIRGWKRYLTECYWMMIDYSFETKNPCRSQVSPHFFSRIPAKQALSSPKQDTISYFWRYHLFSWRNNEDTVELSHWGHWRHWFDYNLPEHPSLVKQVMILMAWWSYMCSNQKDCCGERFINE